MKDKAEIESELAKLVDSYNNILREYKNNQTKLKSIKKEKRELKRAIEEKLNEYRKFI